MSAKCKPVRNVSSSEALGMIRSGRKVLVQFVAAWCSACQKSKPEVDRASCELESTGVEVVRIDVDKEPYMTTKYGVDSFPAVIAFEDGKPTARTEGAEKAEKYVKLANKEG